jgi:hypothetical protein
MKGNCWFHLVLLASLAAVSWGDANEPTIMRQTRHATNQGAITLIYERTDGSVSVDFGGCRIRAIELTSRAGSFDGTPPENMPTSPFNVWDSQKVFLLDQKGLPRLELGRLLPPGLSRQQLMQDLGVAAEQSPDIFLLILSSPMA